MCSNQSSKWSSTSLAWKTWIPGKHNQKLHMSCWKLQLKQHEATTNPHFFSCVLSLVTRPFIPFKKARSTCFSTIISMGISNPAATKTTWRPWTWIKSKPTTWAACGAQRDPPYPSVPSHGTFRPKPTLDGLVWGCFGSGKNQGFFYDFVQTHHPRRSSVILPVIICRKSLAPAMILPISYLEHVHPWNTKLLLPWKLPGNLKITPSSKPGLSILFAHS